MEERLMLDSPRGLGDHSERREPGSFPEPKRVIAPKTPGVLDYFGPEELLFFEPGDADDLAVRIEYAFRHPEDVIEIVERGQKIYQRHKWSNERLRLLGLANRLLTRCKVAAPETRT
jgi:hypothetical protein